MLGGMHDRQQQLNAQEQQLQFGGMHAQQQQLNAQQQQSQFGGMHAQQQKLNSQQQQRQSGGMHAQQQQPNAQQQQRQSGGMHAQQQQPNAQQQQLEYLQESFSALGDQLFDCLSNLEVDPSQLASQWNQVLAVREAIAKMHGIHWPASAGGSPALASSFPPAPLALTCAPSAIAADGKMKLQQLYAKRTGHSARKDAFAFQCEPVDGGFQASVACDMWEGCYMGQTMTSKKAAEDSAAQAAYEAQGGPMSAIPPVQSNDDPKSRLGKALQAKGIGVSPGTIVYETWDDAEGEGQVMGRVTLTCFGEPQPFDGAAQLGVSTKARKKAAEQSAAEAALLSIADQLEMIEDPPPKSKRKRENDDQVCVDVGL